MLVSGSMVGPRRIVVSRRSAFSLVDLLAAIGIMAVLVAILLPVLGKARQQASREGFYPIVRTAESPAVSDANSN